MTFSPGDRVRYTGAMQGYETNPKVGETGTVYECESNSNIRVTWDKDALNSQITHGPGVFPANLELIQEANVTNDINVGDEVVVDSIPRSWEDSRWYRVIPEIGDRGIVENVSTNGVVRVRMTSGVRSIRDTTFSSRSAFRKADVAPAVPTVNADSDTVSKADVARVIRAVAARGRREYGMCERVDVLAKSALNQLGIPDDREYEVSITVKVTAEKRVTEEQVKNALASLSLPNAATVTVGDVSVSRVRA